MIRFKKLKTHLHIILVVITISIYSLFTINSWRGYKDTPYQFVNDVDQYYSYLPGAFIHNDLSFNYPNNYWLIKNKNGKKLAKGTIGMSIMYSPFFLIGHLVALNTDYIADGYSKPYSVAIQYGTLVYFLLGIFFLIKSLDSFFNKWISFSVSLLLFFGTNLLHYVLNSGEMPHSYLFALFSLCLYLTIKWHKSPKPKYFLFLSFFFGLAVIIRPVEIIFVLFFLLFNVYNKETFIKKCRLLKTHYIQLLIGAFIFFIPIIPQLIYWKTFGGDWLVYSYGSNEKFFFNDPKILEFLLGYRKGWFMYTPLMIFAVIGMIFLNKKVKEMKLAVPFFIVFIIYLLSSWWCWWYGGSMGMRGMIQYYVFLAFPLAAFIDIIVRKKIKLFIIGPFILFFAYFGFLYNYKYRHWSLHWDSMTKEAYWFTFMDPKLSGEEIQHLGTLLKKPDYKAAQKGDR